MHNPLREEILKWNNQFPIDKWWRDKYNIPYGSKDHLEADLIDQLFEYYEEAEYKESVSKDMMYRQGIWLKKQEKSKEQRMKSLEQEAREALSSLPDDIEF